MFSCGASPFRLQRHNKAGRQVIKPLYQSLGYTYDERNVGCHISSNKRVDARCRNTAVDHRDEALDITIGCPACASYVTLAAATDCAATTDALEAAKQKKHGRAATEAGMQYVTCALTTYGGWGNQFLKKHVRPTYIRMKEEDKKQGGTGWEPRRWLQRLLESMSISVARANRAMLVERTTPHGVA